MLTADNLPYEQVGNKEPVCIADEVPFEIPDSWEWVRLVNVGDSIGNAFADGPFGSNLKKEHYTDNKEVRIIQLSNIGESGWRNENTKYTTYSHLETIQRSEVEHGNIVIAKMMPAGRAIIVPNLNCKFVLSSDAVKFVPHPALNLNYLLYAINSPCFRNQVVSETHGVTRIRTSLGKLKTYFLPIPPLEEQERIVRHLELVLPKLSEYSIAEEKRQELNLVFPEQMKKSILQWAVQGKLVPQDPDDEPASVLLERIRAEKEQLVKDGKIKRDKHESVIYRRDNSHYEKLDGIERCIDDEIPFEIPDSWAWCRLGHILTKLTDGAHSTPKYTETGVPFLSVKDMSSGYIDFSNTKFISEEEHSELYKRCDPRRGDILITKVGTTGIPVYVDTDTSFSLFVSVAQMRFIQEQTSSDYLMLVLQSPLVQKQCAESTKGVGNKNWVMRDIASTLICIPPFAEQKRICEFYNSLLPLLSF